MRPDYKTIYARVMAVDQAKGTVAVTSIWGKSMPSYGLQADVTEWIDECGGVEAAHHYLSTIAETFARAGEANRAYYYLRMAQEIQRIINSPPPPIVRTRRNALKAASE